MNGEELDVHEKVFSLTNRVDSRIRNKLRGIFNEISSYPNASTILESLSLLLLRKILENAGDVSEYNEFAACLERVNDLNLLPSNYSAALESIHNWTTPVNHAHGAPAVAPEEPNGLLLIGGNALQMINLFLVVLKWFYCTYNRGPQVPSIYSFELDLSNEATYENEERNLIIPVHSRINESNGEYYVTGRGGFEFVDWELREWPSIYENENGPLVRLPYRGNSLVLPSVLVLGNADRKYSLDDIELKLLDGSFTLTSSIEDGTQEPFNVLMERIDFIEDELSLRNIETNYDKVILEMQRASYDMYVHTNLVLDWRNNEAPSLRDILTEDRCLEPLKDSPLANVLGINILISTASGKLIMKRRSNRVLVFPREIEPAASGTFSVADFLRPNCNNCCSLKYANILREAVEEIGISYTDILLDQIYFLGITRELIRGGQPELFLFAKSTLVENQVRDNYRWSVYGWESQELVFHTFPQMGNPDSKLSDQEKVVFLNCLNRFLERRFDLASMPLLTAIALWSEFFLPMR